ncbi:hypothetical protein BBJ28_00023738 [Nothophytophthora sp. Chile5]|nr:hypothetical protein BBJ28_00023738 [Nothophytophthora sp. Chile5]
MTREEIQESIERHQNGGGGTSAPVPAVMQQQPLATAAPMMMAAAAPVQQIMQRRARYPAYVRVLWTVSTLVGAASILTFLWNYALQSGYLPWLRSTPRLLEAAKVQEEKEKEAKRDEELLAELTGVSAAIQKQTAELAKLSTSLDEKERDLRSQTLLSAQISSSLAEQGNAQSIAELKAEISTLKALLLAKKDGNADDPSAAVSQSEDTGKQIASSSVNKVSVAAAAPVKPQKQPVATPAVVSKAERMEKALKKLRTENSLEQLKLAAGILSMYVKNLVENPEVPRYRRIATGNANFKQKIEPLKHYEELLKSIGFETAGLNMEWKWHTASRTTGAFDENLAILRALLKALQSLSSPNASSNLSLEEIAHASLETYYAEKEKQKQGEVSNAASTITTTSTTVEKKNSTVQSTMGPFSGNSASSGPSSTDLDAFMARLEQKTSLTSSSWDDTSATKTLESTDLPVAAATATEDEEKSPVPVTSAIAPTVTASGPSYPKSFTEVMDLIQKGEPVPGIREIEDKLSVDSSALLSKQTEGVEAVESNDSSHAAPAKPWEKVKA